MLQQRNNIVWLRLNGLIRYLMVHFACNGPMGIYLVNEYPKSGGTWLGQMISEALNLPFPRNRLPVLRASILHGHYFQTWNVRNAVVVWRDGRDLIISQYYHYLFENEHYNSYLVGKTRNDLQFSDYHDIRSNLPRFIKYVYQEKQHLRFSWSDFVVRWWKRDQILHTKYENLRLNTENELKRIVFELSGVKLPERKVQQIASKYSFEQQSKRRTGDENIKSFMRKGVIGDWRNHFNRQSREIFSKFAGNELIQLGYEKDDNWIADDN